MDRLRQRVTWLALSVLACGGRAKSDGADATGGAETGGSETAPTGGAASGGKAAGGASAGGTNAGGASTGGTSSGGMASGGVATGGRGNTGGTPSGGASGGGTPSGGTSSGGVATGGRTNTGGTQSGGASGGRTATGGSATGGSATGGSATGGSAVGGSTTSGTGPGGATDGGAGGADTGGTTGTGGASSDCAVGVQIDACCSEPIAVESNAFEDPCVLPYRRYYSDEDLAGCPGSEKCLMVNCTHPAPPSRVVARRNGQCVFDDECITAAEPYSVCLVATDYNYCCSCPEVIPRVVVEADPCVLTEGFPESGTCADCSTVDCVACDTPEPSIFCEYDSVTKLSTCRGRIVDEP